MKRGKFIVFEGIDGSGKSLQLKLLRKKLPEAVFTQEHTQGVVGKLVERVLNKEVSLNPVSLQLLFVADREDHLQKVVVPAIEKGKIVVSDRYFWSTVAYGGLVAPKEWLLQVNRICLPPDLVIFLDVSPQTALKRIGKRREKKTIFEEKKKLVKIRKNYYWLVDQFPKRAAVVDGEQSPERVHQEIWQIIKERIKLP